ncbi:MAG: NADH-quinone oxidoreductase subunit M [Hydrotalea sp.]|nr:NADH-quinone oxidoreductase subunit M [Hydrotalea sp.]
MSFPILSFMTYLPLVGALLLLLFKNRESDKTAVRVVAMVFALVNFFLSLAMLFAFKPGVADAQMVEQSIWIPSLNIGYHMGVDGLSVYFVLLSTFLTPLSMLASWRGIQDRVRDYMIAFLVLETMMIGCFVALDMFLFYMFFEGVIIPMFLIIGVWGGENRIKASFKFFLYTLLGSVLMLIALITMMLMAGTSDMTMAMNKTLPTAIPTAWQYLFFLALFASFAVKIPMWPVHTWLPDAHVEAPTAGSMILAGVLLKMGGYGFLRLSLPWLPEASAAFAPFIFGLSIIAVVWASLVALAQADMKKLIAYSSIAHMGIVTAGIFAGNAISIMGAMVQMLAHGITSAGLFFGVGVLYDRTHSRQIADYGGVAKKMPWFATMFFFLTLSSIGLPGTFGFLGEFISMLGVYQSQPMVALGMGLGMVLGAAYMLVLYARVFFGDMNTADNSLVKTLKDIDLREWLIFIPLVAVTFWFGIYSKVITSYIEPVISKIILLQ